MYSKKILMLFFSLLIGLLIIPFLCPISQAFQWNHSKNQIPFDGYYANYEGWYYDQEDPFNITLPIYNTKINILYFDIDPNDYLMQFNLSVKIEWVGNNQEAVYNGTVVLENRTIFDFQLIEGSITVSNAIVRILEIGDIFWCLNNISLGDGMLPENDYTDIFVFDIIGYQGFSCFHGIQASSFQPDSDYWVSQLSDIYYDTYSGAIIGLKAIYLYPELKNAFEFKFVSGNLPRESSLSTMWMLIGLGAGILAVFIALRYRSNISQTLRRSMKKKDKRSTGKQRRKKKEEK